MEYLELELLYKTPKFTQFGYTKFQFRIHLSSSLPIVGDGIEILCLKWEIVLLKGSLKGIFFVYVKLCANGGRKTLGAYASIYICHEVKVLVKAFIRRVCVKQITNKKGAFIVKASWRYVNFYDKIFSVGCRCRSFNILFRTSVLLDSLTAKVNISI